MTQTDQTIERAVDHITQVLGYRFRNPSLLQTALTHRSYSGEVSVQVTSAVLGTDNQRLEYLGDAVLGLIIAEALWSRLPSAQEGPLSRLRAATVSETSLALTAQTIGLGKILLLGRGEDITGGRERSSVLADALEAVFAAVYLDGGLESARDVVMRCLGKRIDEVVSRGVQDDKSALQETVQALYKITPKYEIVATEGPDHDRIYEVMVTAENVVSAKGRGRSKKEAEQSAARLARKLLEKNSNNSGENQ